jgi:hypothetical protein
MDNPSQSKKSNIAIINRLQESEEATFKKVANDLLNFLEVTEPAWDEYLDKKAASPETEITPPPIYKHWCSHSKSYKLQPLDKLFEKDNDHASGKHLHVVHKIVDVLLNGGHAQESLDYIVEKHDGIFICYHSSDVKEWREEMVDNEKRGVIIHTKPVRSEEKSKPHREIELTPNQQRMAQELNKHFRLFENAMQLAGFYPRPPLIISPSGSGKTTTVRAFAHLNNLPFLCVEPTSWMLMNAKLEPYTLNVIRDFVDRNPRGVIAVDEMDKFCKESAQDWWKAVQNEAMAFVEKKVELLERFWPESCLEKLQNNFLIVGMGTWQSVFRGVTSYDEVDFDSLVKSGKIPEELLARFSDPILLRPPTKNDFKKALIRIHDQIKDPLTEKVPNAEERLDKLIQQAEESEKNMRWLEDYATKKLLESLPTEPISAKVGKPQISREWEETDNLDAVSGSIDHALAKRQRALFEKFQANRKSLPQSAPQAQAPKLDEAADKLLRESFAQELKTKSKEIRTRIVDTMELLQRQCVNTKTTVIPLPTSKNIDLEEVLEFTEDEAGKRFMRGESLEPLTLQVTFPYWEAWQNTMLETLENPDAFIWQTIRAEMLDEAKKYVDDTPELSEKLVFDKLWGFTQSILDKENPDTTSPIYYINRSLRFVVLGERIQSTSYPALTQIESDSQDLNDIEEIINKKMERITGRYSGIEQLRESIKVRLKLIQPATEKALETLEQSRANFQEKGNIVKTHPIFQERGDINMFGFKFALKRIGMTVNSSLFPEDHEPVPKFLTFPLKHYTPSQETLLETYRKFMDKVDQDQWDQLPGEFLLAKCTGTDELIENLYYLNIFTNVPTAKTECVRLLIQEHGELLYRMDKAAWDKIHHKHMRVLNGEPPLQVEPDATSSSIDNPKQMLAMWAKMEEAILKVGS